MSCCLTLVLSVILFATYTNSTFQELQLERFEQVLGHDLFNGTGMRVKKFNRTTSVMDGVSELFRDVGDEYRFTMTVAHSRLGNNQFNEYPMKISKDKTCNILNGSYKEYQPYYHNNTNLPWIGEEWVCPFPKGVYWVKNLALSGDWVPPVVPTGYWRLTTEIYDAEDTLIAQFHTFMHLTREIV